MAHTKKLHFSQKIRAVKVVFEDQDIMVLYKPSGILVQADSTGDMDLISWCRRRIRGDSRRSRRPFIGMVQRLDRPVAGVLVFAKSPKVAAALNTIFRDGNVNKNYYAVVHGNPPDQDLLEDYIVKDTCSRISRITSDPNKGKQAVLTYHVIDRHQSRSLLDISLETGRHHQIRVQLSHRGFPIIADRKYGSREVLRDPGMIALWAYHLHFPHPVTHKPLDIFSPKPVHWPWYGHRSTPTSRSILRSKRKQH